MKKTLILALIVLLKLTVEQMYAQQLRAAYPVQVSAYLNPPYSLYLGEYCSGTKEKLMIRLLNRDLQEPELSVRLHISIQAANGIKIETKDYNSYPSIRLSSGVPYLLTQADLCPYLQPESWDVQGVLTNGRLPEGMIEIGVRVYEVNTGRLLSQTSCARAWITLNRPPLLNLPANKTAFPFREPINMLFQWTPRHQALSNVEYEFVLKEIWDDSLSPEAVFASSPEIYKTSTRSTALVYTAMQPPLLENKRYAWQVRAVVREGFDELNVFENQGYSEIFSFSISESCHAPTEVSHRQDAEHLVVSWIPAKNAQRTVVAYRGKEGGGEWHLTPGNANYAHLFDLAFYTEYEYKVGTLCVDGSIAYSPVYTVILEDWRKDPEAACGVLPAKKAKGQKLLPELNVGDVFYSGDFSVTVMSVTGSDGVFSGTGWIRMPLVAYSKIAVQFDQITLDSEKQMIRGFVESSYDKLENQIGNGDAFFHGGNNTGKTKTGAVTSQVKVDFTIPDGATVLYNKDTGKLEIRDKDGNLIGEIDIPDDKKKDFDAGNPPSITIQDKEGNIHTITKDENGNLTSKKTGTQGNSLPEGSFSETELASKKAIVEFYPLSNSKYAFDRWKEYYQSVSLIANEGKYEHIGAYNVPCQLIPPGGTEDVGVKITILDKKSIHEDSIIFKTKTGYTVECNDGVLTLSGGKENDAQDLYALYPDGKGGYLTLGKLKILSYSEPTIRLVLVPIRSEGQVYTTDVNEVRKKLDEVYGRLGISWDVTMDEPFDYPTADINSEGSDLFSRYTDEMKELNGAYMDSVGKLDKKAVYIFILRSGNIKQTGIAGDIPRGKQFGYVFTDSENLPWTIAHEVAHGKFKLRHTFDGAYGNGLAKETENLMNYHEGTFLAKWQWDEIFDPALLVNPFESDEDGMRKKESERSQITRFMYAIQEVIQDKVKLGSSKVLMKDDRKKLDAQKDFSVEADHIFYNESISDYFEAVKLCIYFDATHRNKDSNGNFYSSTEKNYAFNKAWYVESLDAVITFAFKKEGDLTRFKNFIGEKVDLDLPKSSVRKAFFVHGTKSESERWMEHPLAETVLLKVANTNQYDDRFDWTDHNHITNGVIDRNLAAQELAKYVLSKSVGFPEIVLIGHSHGGNVSLQAVNQLVEKGKTVYLISTSTPAYNDLTVNVLYGIELQNCEFIEKTVGKVEMTTTKLDAIALVNKYKNPENPINAKLKAHLHLWNIVDGVAGGMAGDDYYKPNGITENIKVSVDKEYSDVYGLIERYHLLPEFVNAHGFDANRPQLIYRMFLKGVLKPIN